MAATIRVATVPALGEVAGLVHGFEQRLGPSGWEERDAGRARVARALADHGRLYLLKQVHGTRGRLHLDVRAANVAQLLAAGVPRDRIHDVADCTSCRADLYHSYRRDGPRSGRMINYIGWSAAAGG